MKETHTILFEDPNFEAHLPGLLKVGNGAWADHDLAQSLRVSYMKFRQVKESSMNKIISRNTELAIQIEETANAFGKDS